MVVEDEPAIRQELCQLLSNALYQVSEVEDFTDVAGTVLEKEPDLLLLDLNLPVESGYDICTEIRKSSEVPIIFLTSRTDSMDELTGMLKGGDDYITKPFQAPILLARIAAVLKRSARAKDYEEQTTIVCGDLTLDIARGVIYRKTADNRENAQAELTKNELKILHCLLLHKGQIVSRMDLIEYLWDQQVFLVWLSVHYFSRRNYFKKMKEMMERIDQRYLLGELMPDSVHLEDQIYRELIRKSNKSVIERIRAIEDEKKEYREYIESWVHEIKAPITGIDLMCENHKETLTRRIALENRKIENYVDMALYYARSDEVYQDYMIRETDLGQTAAEILQRNKQYLIQKGIQAEVNCPDVAYTDGKWIGFILNQLLLNSAKYSKEQGAYIRIFTEHIENGVRLTVKDNGIGIKPEEIERIFEKGFTGSNGRKTERSTGMGLYSCK